MVRTMITKWLWEELIFEINYMKKYGANDEDKFTNFFFLIILIMFTPLLLLIDLLLSPFEILYWLFCKWLESDKKEKKKTNNKNKILKLFINRRNDNGKY